MKKRIICAALAALVGSSAAVASHVDYTDTPFPSRGACEARTADLSSDDREFLQIAFPDLFSSDGEVESFLTRAFSCELNPSDGQWYITNHIEEVLGSDWFQRR